MNSIPIFENVNASSIGITYWLESQLSNSYTHCIVTNVQKYSFDIKYW